MKAIEIAKSNKGTNFNMSFSTEVADALKDIKSLMKSNNITSIGLNEQWMAIKIFERDSNFMVNLQ